MSAEKKPSKAISTAALFVAAFFWGTTFVAQSIGARSVSAFTFLSGRSIIGTLFLLPFILFRNKKERAADPGSFTPEQKKTSLKLHLRAGLISGFLLFAASSTQQMGIAYTTASKASFITTLYVVLVPIFSLFIRKKPHARVWIAVLFSVTGLYLLCIKDGFTLAVGDSLVMLCAVLFALQIMAVNHYSDRVDALKLSCWMFFFEFIFGTISMFLFEEPHIADILTALPAILYAGILSNGVAFTAQVIGQKGLSPSVASLIMCLESVFGALSGWIILKESMTSRELFGCGLMFLAVIIAEAKLPGKRKPKTPGEK